MTTTVLHVEGMACGHCVMAVNKAVKALDGIRDVHVDLNGKTVTVEHDPALASVAALKDAIEAQGYDVVG